MKESLVLSAERAQHAMPQYDPGFPICIDLDGTIVKEHTLLHIPRAWDWALLSLVSPPSWPSIKSKWVQHADLSKTNWTYHAPLIAQMHLWHSQGTPLYLVTGAPEKIAHHMAEKIGLFSDVWSSSYRHNLVGSKKATLLCHHFGKAGYTYVGDSWKDRLVWKTSKDIITVAPAGSYLVRYLQQSAQPNQRIFCFSASA